MAHAHRDALEHLHRLASELIAQREHLLALHRLVLEGEGEAARHERNHHALAVDLETHLVVQRRAQHVRTPHLRHALHREVARAGQRGQRVDVAHAQRERARQHEVLLGVVRLVVLQAVAQVQLLGRAFLEEHRERVVRVHRELAQERRGGAVGAHHVLHAVVLQHLVVAHRHLEGLRHAHHQRVLVAQRALLQVDGVDAHHGQLVALHVQRRLALERILQHVVRRLQVRAVHRDLLRARQAALEVQVLVEGAEQAHLLQLHLVRAPVRRDLDLPVAGSHHAALRGRHGDRSLHQLLHLVVTERAEGTLHAVEGVGDRPGTRRAGSLLDLEFHILDHHKLLGVEHHGSTEVVAETTIRRARLLRSIVALHASLRLVPPSRHSLLALPTEPRRCRRDPPQRS